jgi:hypothetical protein
LFARWSTKVAYYPQLDQAEFWAAGIIGDK